MDARGSIEARAGAPRGEGCKSAVWSRGPPSRRGEPEPDSPFPLDVELPHRRGARPGASRPVDQGLGAAPRPEVDAFCGSVFTQEANLYRASATALLRRDARDGTCARSKRTGRQRGHRTTDVRSCPGRSHEAVPLLGPPLVPFMPMKTLGELPERWRPLGAATALPARCPTKPSVAAQLPPHCSSTRPTPPPASLRPSGVTGSLMSGALRLRFVAGCDIGLLAAL